MQKITRYQRPILAVLLGASAPLSFAPYSYWPVIFISLAGLLLLIHNRPAKSSFKLSFLWALAYFGVGISWVHVSIDTFGGVPKFISYSLMLLLSAYLALYPALFGWAVNRFFTKSLFVKLIVAGPALWLINEWLRGWVFTGFPWLWVGYSQIDSSFSSYAPIGGVELISYIIALGAGALAYAILSRKPVWIALPLVLWSGGYLLQKVDWVKPNSEKTTFALIQGNIDQAIKWKPSERWPTIIKYAELTQKNWDADIIIWPEAAIPAFEYQIPSFLSDLDSSARESNTGFITGILNRTDSNALYNSVLTLGEGAEHPYRLDINHRYHKHHLLPFGEFVPFEKWLRPIAPLFNLPMSAFSEGAYIQPNLNVNGRRFVSALCYEIAFGEQVRANTTDQTDFILTLSNDAWFGHSNGPLQHMEIARMRALELGKPLIRVTNNGVTAITDDKGHVIKQLPQFETAVLKATVTSSTGSTPYRMFGSIPLYLWAGLLLIVALLIHRRATK
ncbi:apolipoprotein N-acyltransferase [Vibrio sp.]|nr:apolipoprotein N-acyltransferase [Vibrio sp.]